MSAEDHPISNETGNPLMPPTPCPNHYVHPYHFTELALGGGSNQQSYFRVMMFFSKKPGLTDEFFHEHWKSVHADLTMQVQGAGVDLVRYVQFHQERKDIEAFSEVLAASGGSMSIMPYDGAAEFWAESPEKFTNFMKNLYASSHLVGCGKRFVDLVQGYHVMVGYDNLILGRGVPSAGSDGILTDDSRLVQPEVTPSSMRMKGSKDFQINVEEVTEVLV